MSFQVPEKLRDLRYSSKDDGNNGLFFYRNLKGVCFKIIASDGEGWEHVSVSLPRRCPTWEEMSKIKSLFWDNEDTVIQYHPPESEYVNNHPYCLHMWRPIHQKIPLPDSSLVGVKQPKPSEGNADE